MRTPALSNAFELLTDLNVNLNLYAFTAKEFERDYARLSGRAAENYVPDAYGGNPYVDRINIRISDLPEKMRASESFTCRAYFVVISTVIETYARDLLEELDAFSPSRPNEREPVADRLFAKLSMKLEVAIGTERAATLNYLRLRRNAVVHRADKIPYGLKQMIVTEGPVLDAYWPRVGHPLQALRFADLEIFQFSEAMLVDILRVSRTA